MALLTGLSVVLVLSACPTSSGGTGVVSITASAGALTQSGSGWSFDAGTVPQYATESITFTVTNTGSAAFTATGAVSFTPNDFSTNISGSFTVAAGSSNSFVGTFTPTTASQETGTLTLTPTDGNPIVISLKGTPDQSFVVYNTTFSPVQVTNSSGSWGACNAATFSIYNNATSNVTLSGLSPFVTISGAGSADFTVSTPPTSPINSGAGPVIYTVSATAGGGGTITATVTAVDSATGATFTFPVQIDDQYGC
jgi:VCBS repeat-containing protein